MLFIAASSGIIWNLVIYIINIEVKRIPPTRLNLKDKARRIKTIPKYIGFLEYLKIPVTTREEAFSIEIGLTVVSWFLNEIIAVTRTHIPTIKEIILNELSIEKLNSGKNDFDK